MFFQLSFLGCFLGELRFRWRWREFSSPSQRLNVHGYGCSTESPRLAGAKGNPRNVGFRCWVGVNHFLSSFSCLPNLTDPVGAQKCLNTFSEAFSTALFTGIAKHVLPTRALRTLFLLVLSKQAKVFCLI